jgi:hypothetical protein
MLNIRQKIKTLGVKIILFFVNLKDYVYSFRDSTEVKIKIRPYEPEIGQKAQEWLTKIRNISPEPEKIELNFIGSASFGLNGQGDIDIIGKCDPVDLKILTIKISKLIANTYNEGSEFSEWRFKDKYIINFFLASPNSRLYRGYLDLYLALKNDNKLQNEYQKIKNASNGLSIRDYNRIRKPFFNKAVYQYRYQINLF